MKPDSGSVTTLVMFMEPNRDGWNAQQVMRFSKAPASKIYKWLVGVPVSKNARNMMLSKSPEKQLLYRLN